MSKQAVDYPLQEVAEEAIGHVMLGCTVHQKYTCGHCGVRQTMAEPNKFFTSGRCEECREITLITKCNYLLIRDMR